MDSTSPWAICLCLDVGEVSAALLAGNTRKIPVGLMNAPSGAPSPWCQPLIDGCQRAELQIGNKKRGVALWHMPSIHHCRGAEGLKREGGWVGREEGDER